jgi:hypothetical protein
MKIRSVGAEFFHAGRLAGGRDEASSRFSRFLECSLKKARLFPYTPLTDFFKAAGA